LKNLDYRKDSSNVHQFISPLNNKCDINNREVINLKNSSEYLYKELAKAFTTFYISADHIPTTFEETGNIYGAHYKTEF
jgi:hypothetical protein